MKENYEIIVAHYNENLDWLRPYAKNAIVYHKGNDNGPRFPVKKWLKLPNIGRESHTYLYHIVNNYNNLPKYSLFFQGGILDHIKAGDVYQSIEDYLNEVRKYGFSCARLFLLTKKEPQIEYLGKFLDMINSGSLEKSNYTFADFYKKLFNRDQPYYTPCFFGANFGVSEKLIKKRDLSFYTNALDLIPNHPNPEEGHYYERFWFVIFNKDYSFHSITKILFQYIRGLKDKIKK